MRIASLQKCAISSRGRTLTKLAPFSSTRSSTSQTFCPLCSPVVHAGTLLRKHKGHLKVTPAGRRMMEEPNLPALPALLFHIALWHLDLGYPSRGMHHGWPQHHARHSALVSVLVAATPIGRRICWNSCRGNHLGRRSCVSANQQAGTYQRKRSDPGTAKDLAREGAVRWCAPVSSTVIQSAVSSPARSTRGSPTGSRPAGRSAGARPGRLEMLTPIACSRVTRRSTVT